MLVGNEQTKWIELRRSDTRVPLLRSFVVLFIRFATNMTLLPELFSHATYMTVLSDLKLFA